MCSCIGLASNKTTSAIVKQDGKERAFVALLNPHVFSGATLNSHTHAEKLHEKIRYNCRNHHIKELLSNPSVLYIIKLAEQFA